MFSRGSGSLKQDQFPVKREAFFLRIVTLELGIQNPTNTIRFHDNLTFVIDLHFEKYYTHHIEVTPICAYFMEILRLVD